jgi:hypothetical protein
MKNINKVIKLFTAGLLLTVIFACNVFGSDITGVWIISGFGDSKMQLQQSNNQVVGIAYYQGQLQGNIYGQISGTQITLQIRNTYSGIVTYTGVVSPDGNSMQLKGNNNQTLTAFKSG